VTTSGRPRPLLCFDVSTDGFIVAAGTDLQGEDASILYWDPRNPVAPLRIHASTHSDDITSLHFLPTPSSPTQLNSIILSASTDGLISTSNAEEEDEDEAALYVGNWGCSVSQAGWIHAHGDVGTGIWAASDMETFSTWSNELDMLQSVDVRGPTVHNHGQTWVTDYLIGCHNMTQQHNPALAVFVGSNEGDVALMSTTDHSPAAPWSLHRLYTAGHAGIVRSILWDEVNNILITGGEDARLNAWANPPLDPDASLITMMDVDAESEVEADDAADVDLENTLSRKRGSGQPGGREKVGQFDSQERECGCSPLSSDRAYKKIRSHSQHL